MTRKELTANIESLDVMLTQMPDGSTYRQARLKALWLRSELNYLLQQTKD